MADTNIKEKQTSTNTQIELRICANPTYLRLVRKIVRSVNEAIGLDDKDDLVTLAVEEALANVIRHSYGGPCDKPVILTFNEVNYGTEKKALEILIRDFGKQVDPEIIKGRDFDEIRAGGLGVHFIQSAMDEVQYRRADDCGMQLRMIKYIN